MGQTGGKKDKMPPPNSVTVFTRIKKKKMYVNNPFQMYLDQTGTLGN